jgi:hypothetical protein
MQWRRKSQFFYQQGAKCSSAGQSNVSLGGQILFLEGSEMGPIAPVRQSEVPFSRDANCSEKG